MRVEAPNLPIGTRGPIVRRNARPVLPRIFPGVTGDTFDTRAFRYWVTEG
jgi:hypothetical protein